jgi:hypothetical protein
MLDSLEISRPFGHGTRFASNALDWPFIAYFRSSEEFANEKFQ